MAERFMPTPDMLAGAKPVQAPALQAVPTGRFRPTPEMLAGAKPLAPRTQHTYRESTDTVVAAPYGLKPDQLEYLDDVQNHKQTPDNYFGFTKVPIADIAKEMLEYPKAVAKGAAATGISANAVLEAGRMRQIGEATKEVFGEEKPFEQMSSSERLDKVRLENTPAFLTYLFGSERDKALTTGTISRLFKSKDAELEKADSLIAASKDIMERNKKFLTDNNLVREDGAKGFAFDIGSVGTSIVASIGLSVASKNPVIAAGLFSDLQKNQTYLEAQEKGWENVDADRVSTIMGNTEGALEFIGMNYFLKAAQLNKPLQRIGFRMFEEAAQEMSQTGSEEAISQLSGLREEDVEGAVGRTFYSGVLGAIGGGAPATVMEIMSTSAEKEGLPPELGEFMAKRLEQNMGEIEGVFEQMLRDEGSPLRNSPETEARVAKYYQDFQNGKPIDTNDMTPDEQALFDQLKTLSVMPMRQPETVKYKLNVDNPGGEWLARKQADAEKDMVEYAGEDTARAKGLRGSVTGWYGKILPLPTDFLDTIPGAMGEEKFRNDPTATKRAMMDKAIEEGKENEIFNEENPIMIGVNHKGQAFILEGNHRVGVAKTQGRPFVHAEFKYFNGGEKAQGAFSPEVIQQQAVAGAGSVNNPPPPTDNTTAAEEPDREGDYARVANEPPSRGKSSAGIVVNDIGNLAADAFVPVSTRLGHIDQGLKHAVRRFTFDTGLHTHEDNQVAKPFIENVSNRFSEQDYRVLDLALKNADFAKVDELMLAYDLTQEWQAVRGLLEKIHSEAKAAGMDIGHVENYFPRKVKRDMAPEYMAFLRGLDDWSAVKIELDAVDPDGSMTAEEKAEFVSKWLRGFKNNKLQMAAPGFTKGRSIDYITADMNRFYEDSMPTLINYISGMRHGIESRKLFGASEEETDKNIGIYVNTLIEQGVIKPDQELLLRRILKAVVEPTGTRGAVTWAKNATYIYTMGSPISALTQLQDLAFSLHHNGYFNTAVSLSKAVTGWQQLTKEDIGVSNILQEFEDGGRSGTAVRKVFKAVGLSFMDDLGKSTYLDAAYKRLKKAAVKNTPAFQEKMEVIFGEEAGQVTQDLKDKRLTENVKYLLFSELSDVQPISLAEMPIGYLRGGNGRIFYMLKTYTVKQFDIYRREIFDELASGSLRRQAKGMRNLISLASALMLLGMGTDALKDLLLGREIDIDDLVMDNLLKVTGFTKYQIYTAKRDGIMNTFWKTLFIPPVGAPIDDISRDLYALNTGDKDVEELDIWQRVPGVGKFYYWWWGGGSNEW